MMIEASWEACGQYVRNARTSDNPTGDLVAEVWLGHPNAAEVAKLMASAPVLLEAVKKAEKALDAIADDMTVGDRWTNAGQHLLDALPILRAAIERAEK